MSLVVISMTQTLSVVCADTLVVERNGSRSNDAQKLFQVGGRGVLGLTGVLTFGRYGYIGGSVERFCSDRSLAGDPSALLWAIGNDVRERVRRLGAAAASFGRVRRQYGAITSALYHHRNSVGEIDLWHLRCTPQVQIKVLARSARIDGDASAVRFLGVEIPIETQRRCQHQFLAEQLSAREILNRADGMFREFTDSRIGPSVDVAVICNYSGFLWLRKKPSRESWVNANAEKLAERFVAGSAERGRGAIIVDAGPEEPVIREYMEVDRLRNASGMEPAVKMIEECDPANYGVLVIDDGVTRTNVFKLALTPAALQA